MNVCLLQVSNFLAPPVENAIVTIETVSWAAYAQFYPIIIGLLNPFLGRELLTRRRHKYCVDISRPIPVR